MDSSTAQPGPSSGFMLGATRQSQLASLLVHGHFPMSDLVFINIGIHWPTGREVYKPIWVLPTSVLA